MVSTTDRDRTEKLGITLHISLLKQVDNKCGDIPRSTFIRRAMESYLNGDETKMATVPRLQRIGFILG